MSEGGGGGGRTGETQVEQGGRRWATVSEGQDGQGRGRWNRWEGGG